MTIEIYGCDAYSPSEVARRVETVGVAERSIANMDPMPLAMLVRSGCGSAAGTAVVTFAGMGANLGIVIAGNLLGGSVLVGLAYHVIYRRRAAPAG